MYRVFFIIRFRCRRRFPQPSQMATKKNRGKSGLWKRSFTRSTSRHATVKGIILYTYLHARTGSQERVWMCDSVCSYLRQRGPAASARTLSGVKPSAADEAQVTAAPRSRRHFQSGSRRGRIHKRKPHHAGNATHSIKGSHYHGDQWLHSICLN